MTITVGIGDVTFLLTSLSNQPKSWSLMLSVLIGGTALLVQFLADFERRQAAVERQLAEVDRGHAALAQELGRIVRGEIAKINDATELADRIDRSALSSDSIRKLTALSAELAGRPVTLPYKVAQAEICEHQRNLGIEVRLLDASALNPGRRLLVPDLVIFDREVSYELTAGARFGDTRAPYFIKTRLLVDPQVVSERVRLYEDFYALSVDYDRPS